MKGSGKNMADLHVLPFFAVADDPSHHVSALCLGPAEQRHDRVVLVWNTI